MVKISQLFWRRPICTKCGKWQESLKGFFSCSSLRICLMGRNERKIWVAGKASNKWIREVNSRGLRFSFLQSFIIPSPSLHRVSERRSLSVIVLLGPGLGLGVRVRATPWNMVRQLRKFRYPHRRVPVVAPTLPPTFFHRNQTVAEVNASLD